jgi:hypothetical protein
LRGINGIETTALTCSDPIFGRTLLLPQCPANLVSMGTLEDTGWRVQYHPDFHYFSAKKGATYLRFIKQTSGLYEGTFVRSKEGGWCNVDRDNRQSGTYLANIQNEILVETAPTIKKNLSLKNASTQIHATINDLTRTYTKDQFQRATEARKLHQTTGHPSEERLP